MRLFARTGKYEIGKTLGEGTFGKYVPLLLLSPLLSVVTASVAFVWNE